MPGGSEPPRPRWRSAEELVRAVRRGRASARFISTARWRAPTIPSPLPEATVASRAARLCAAAERAWREHGGEAPVYVIGTEVPVPGGATEDLLTLAVTTPEAAQATIEAHRGAFDAAGLEAAWPRVIALVVQPGVEFDHHKVIDYRPERGARAERASSRARPQFVFEAHSTDYQTPRESVRRWCATISRS